jgi:hypothetical protein
VERYLGGVVEESALGLADQVALVAREEDEFAEVVGKSGLVGLETLLAAVLAAVVDGDAN